MAKRIVSGTNRVPLHKGAPRRYWCQEFLDEAGRLKKGGRGCWSELLRDGQKIPVCPGHSKPVKKARFKRVEERHAEALHKAQMQIGTLMVWSDEGKRKAKCHLCMGVIDPGERRIAFDGLPRWGAVTTAGGGVIARMRHYVHAACFIDMIYGGKAGDGCPGCSTRVLQDEFLAVRDMLERRHA